MKIIKPGILPNKKVYFGTCSNCKAEVEFDNDEVRKGALSYTAYCPTKSCYNSICVLPKMGDN